MVRCGRAGFLGAFVALSTAPRASAEQGPELEYTVAAGVTGCPTESEFRAAVAERAGAEPFGSSSERRFVVEVRLDQGELVATGTLVEAGGRAAGTRRFAGEPADCGAVLDGLALALSLAASVGTSDSFEAWREPEPPRSKPPAPTGPVLAKPAKRPEVEQSTAALEPPTEDRAEPTSTPSPSEPLAFGAGLFGNVAFGVGPSASAGVSLVASIRSTSWSLSLEGRIDGRSKLDLEGGGTARTTLLAAAVAPCRHFGLAKACAVGLAGSMRAESVAIAHPDEDAGAYAAAGGRFGLELPVTRGLFVETRLDGLVTLLPVHIRVDDETVWDAPPVSGALSAGFLGVFP